MSLLTARTSASSVSSRCCPSSSSLALRLQPKNSRTSRCTSQTAPWHFQDLGLEVNPEFGPPKFQLTKLSTSFRETEVSRGLCPAPSCTKPPCRGQPYAANEMCAFIVAGKNQGGELKGRGMPHSPVSVAASSHIGPEPRPYIVQLIFSKIFY